MTLTHVMTMTMMLVESEDSEYYDHCSSEDRPIPLPWRSSSCWTPSQVFIWQLNIFSHNKKEEVKSSDCLAFYISAQCDSTVGRKS